MPTLMGTLPKTLWPGLNAIWGRDYTSHQAHWSRIFEVLSSTKAYEEDLQITGYGLAPVKPETEAVIYDTETQGPVSRYTHVVYGLGFIVSFEAAMNSQYKEVASGRIRSLAFSMNQTKEIVHANIFNRAFNSSYTGGDGIELCATDHVSRAGDWQNEPTNAVDFSEAALEDMLILIQTAEDDRGHKIALQPNKLIGPPELSYDFHRVVKSVLQSGTANNDTNAIRDMGLINGIETNPYFDDTDAWFVSTNCPHGMKSFKRMDVRFSDEGEFDTENNKYKAMDYYVPGWTDPHGIYGSPGA